MKKLLALIILGVGLATTSFANYTYINFGVTRSFNSVFQVDNTGNDMVDLSYAVTIAASITLSGGQTGTVIMEQSPDGTNSWVELSRISNGSTGSVVVGISMTDTKTMLLRGIVYPGYYVRLRTVSSGSPSYTFVIGQELGFN